MSDLRQRKTDESNLNKLIIFLFAIYINYDFITNTLTKSIGGLQVVLACILLILSIITLPLRNNKVYLTKSCIYICLFFVLMMIGSKNTLSPIYGSQKTLRFIYINMLVFFIPYIMNFDEKKMLQFIRYILILNFLTVGLSIIQNYDTVLSFNSRVSLSGLNPIWSARQYGETILIILLLLKNQDIKKYKIFYIFMIILLSFLMIATGSKGPIISMILAILISKIYILTSKNRFIKKNIIKNMIYTIIFLIIAWFFIKFIILKIMPEEFLVERFSMINGYGMSGRDKLYDIAIESIKNKPLFGYGVGSYSYISMGIDARYYPHNILLETLVELGFIGIIVLLIPWVKILKNLIGLIINRYSSKSIELFLTLFMYYLINSMVSGDFTGNSNLYLYIALIDISLSRVKKCIEKTRREEKNENFIC